METGKNIRAAPFDWRRGPLEFIKYDFPRLKQLVEDTYAANDNMPIAFVSLSMGGPYFLSFLNNEVSQEWKVPCITISLPPPPKPFALIESNYSQFFIKDKYVHSYTSWDGAFGGSTESILGLTNSNFLSNYISPLLAPFGTTFLTMMQSFPSFLWMFPLQEVLVLFILCLFISSPLACLIPSFSISLKTMWQSTQASMEASTLPPGTICLWPRRHQILRSSGPTSSTSTWLG